MAKLTSRYPFVTTSQLAIIGPQTLQTWSQQGKGRAALAGKRKQPVAQDKCFNCGETGQGS